jgi:hypothetical protein
MDRLESTTRKDLSTAIKRKGPLDEDLIDLQPSRCSRRVVLATSRVLEANSICGCNSPTNPEAVSCSPVSLSSTLEECPSAQTATN